MLVPVVYLACEDDGGSGQPGVFDGGTTGFDAPTSDAPVVPADTGPAPNPVTVNVVKNAQPEAGVTIVFSDAAGTVIDTATTDATGRVVRMLPAGSQVTALLGSAARAQILTVVGVEPGDVLTAVDASELDGLVPTATITAIPAGAPAATLGYSSAAGACNGGGFQAAPNTVNLYDDCVRDRKFPLLVLAQGNAGTVAFTFKKANLAAADGGAVGVDMAGGTWTTTTTTETVAITNLPTTLTRGRLIYGEVANGVNYFAVNNFDPSNPGGTPPVNFEGHPGYPDFVQTEATVGKNSSGGVAYSTIATRRAASPNGGTSSHDLSQLLPFIDSATLDSTTPARAMVTWTTAGAVAADGAFVHVRWSTTRDGGNVQQSTWTVVAPPTATSVKLPILPASAVAWAPASDSSFYSVPVVLLVESSVLQGYAQLRASAGALPPTKAVINDGYAPLAPPLPVDGTLRMTAFTDDGD